MACTSGPASAADPLGVQLERRQRTNSRRTRHMIPSQVMSTLPKESFLALVAVGWVDKQLQRVEVTGLMRAAKEAGLSAADLAEIEAATKKQMDLSALELGGMGQWEQVLTYALAAWIAQVDGVVSTSETDM